MLIHLLQDVIMEDVDLHKLHIKDIRQWICICGDLELLFCGDITIVLKFMAILYILQCLLNQMKYQPMAVYCILSSIQWWSIRNTVLFGSLDINGELFCSGPKYCSLVVQMEYHSVSVHIEQCSVVVHIKYCSVAIQKDY